MESKLRSVTRLLKGEAGFEARSILTVGRGAAQIIDAMGNSSDEVKAQASAVTDSNENEGFAKAVRKFVLVEPSRHDQNLQDR